MTPTGIDYLVQFGGLGIAAYLVWWLTKKLNGKLDSLIASVKENTGAVAELTKAIERQEP